jgi:hypothetical protein
MQDDPTPLDIILSTMRHAFAAGQADKAVDLAKAAAPYIHPKATATAAPLDFSTIRDEQLEQMCELGDYRASAANENSE